ncbi:aldehyde dehydrogenase family protein [Cecembia lonarensis]|uniref:Aldehyde dehydrogenase n=1 Tax=Cecembia lonarensis (strain CCUG 58316 / KCTC 22772 / LW9) TaxID=1225176 RepID=K1LF43_CECL9|nr:aldehyde dehydrogenase family protein [Cecembia lonarensis]EKB50757.1 Coniferyl aldehyde dehydrogenase [Cecembia lonarensis LW9]
MEQVSQEVKHTGIDEVFNLQKTQSLKMRQSPAIQRIALLKKLQNWINEHQEDIRRAIFADFKKPYPEIDISEIFVVSSEIKHAIKNLETWMKPKKVSTPLTMLGSNSYIHYEPKGVCLIISPWNYPFNLAMGPLVSALAAGCTAIIKPSELTPHTAALIRRLVEETFDKAQVAVFEGEVEVAQQLLAKPFDHIFFTGSPSVGKIIMKAAAENLSSVTLELGGKSPAIIDREADIQDAAEKIVWGKFVNCGQTCIAPDYILVQRSIQPAFAEALKVQVAKMYDPSGKGVEKSKDYARIVSVKHLKRLKHLLADAERKGAQIYCGGYVDENECFFEPTILTTVEDNMEVMQEEIFGPILPIVTFDELAEAITYINARPKPLALYAFSKNSDTIKHIFKTTSSGGAVSNDCVLHFLQNELPFGGVNNSGLGKAHGHFGFLAFSNEKAVLQQRIGFTASKPLFPPYGFTGKKIIQSLIKWF